MSKKSRKRKNQHRIMRPDDYYHDGTFEVARFGANTLIKNHRTPAQQAVYEEHLRMEYPVKYEAIKKKIYLLREKVAQCDPYNLLMYLRNASISSQINTFSESEYSSEANAIIRAQEYIQSLLVSMGKTYDLSVPMEKQETLYEQVLSDFDGLYKDLQIFYFYWAEYVQELKKINKDLLNNIIEAQYMYWVRGNRYQIFELEPLKSLLPPHDTVLQELFGMSANNIIEGLAKLQYSLSQGYADALMELAGEYKHFMAEKHAGTDSETAHMSKMIRTNKIADKVFGSALIDVKAITGWDDRFINTWRIFFEV